MNAVCGVADLLRSGGPVRVPLRECCAAALFGVQAPARCAALILEKRGPAPLEQVAAGGSDPIRPRQ